MHFPSPEAGGAGPGAGVAGDGVAAGGGAGVGDGMARLPVLSTHVRNGDPLHLMWILWLPQVHVVSVTLEAPEPLQLEELRQLLEPKSWHTA